MMIPPDRTARYLKILVDAIKVCRKYQPKFGTGSRTGLSLAEFTELYGGDPFYSWLGLDNPRLYAAHKAAGGLTSIYRQIGIAGERLFRSILIDEFKLSSEESKWSYKIETSRGRTRTLSLDARISLDAVADDEARDRLSHWMTCAAAELGVEAHLRGLVFEVRQGYKSKDSKRQNADISNATHAYSSAYLPCILVLSAQIDADVQLRYRNHRWIVLTGSLNETSVLRSTYAFMRDVIGFDLEKFFGEHRETFKREVESVLVHLLRSQE